MTHIDYTKEILNIKDNNKNGLKTQKNGLEVKVFQSYLTYNSVYCDKY